MASAAVVLIYVVKFTVDVAADIKIIREIMYIFFPFMKKKNERKLIKNKNPVSPDRIELREGF